MFDAESRNVYVIETGGRKVHADPQLVYRKLLRAAGGHEALATALRDVGADGGDPNREELAWELLAGAACAAFDVQPLDADGNGLTEQERFALLSDFLHFLDKKKVPAES